jgi:hypothetical protein
LFVRVRALPSRFFEITANLSHTPKKMQDSKRTRLADSAAGAAAGASAGSEDGDGRQQQIIEGENQPRLLSLCCNQQQTVLCCKSKADCQSCSSTVY